MKFCLTRKFSRCAWVLEDDGFQGQDKADTGQVYERLSPNTGQRGRITHVG